ncbi:MAG: serine/threonine protein kinase, partial [Clostridia bacterium]|nr:serine/threonine protein kinase [Deltaproteobacteria bacterium]
MNEKKKTADVEFPSQFGRYLLLDRLASGGMAEVYRARSATDGNRIIAIKCMLPALADDEEFANMFVDEAKLASQLQHPNIVQIFELGKFREQLYIAMELINGRDLRAVVRKAKKRGKPLDAQFVAYVIARAAEGLDYAHHKTALDGTPLRLVHRDVSPQNILVSYDGQVKVVDFGIAKADMRRTTSRVGILKGKFAYMAPEQVKTGDVDGRTDIFALGAVLYETLAGRKLFFGESDYSILERVTSAVLPEEPQAWQYLPSSIA